MADGKSAMLAPLLERLGQNPTAMSLLGQLLGGDSTSEAQDSTANAVDGASAVPSEKEATAAPLPQLPPPKGHDHGHGRREFLLALRPFLSARRCASVDRVLRALELYEVIEEGRRRV